MIQVKNLKKNFGDLEVLKNINLTVQEGEKLVIIGPSGSGKSTLIRCMNYLEEPTAGEVYINDQRLTHKNRGEMARKYSSMVFQQFNLYPHMTVLQNLTLAPIKLQKVPKAEAEAEAMKYLERVGLADKADCYPQNLSGGQQQRVAIARTLALNPDIILFDEPMSALDASTRLTLRFELERIQREFGVTMIYITHDQEEAFSMSNRIMVMSNGAIEQLDTPFNIYHHPANAYIEEFVVFHLMEKLAAFRRFTGK